MKTLDEELVPTMVPTEDLQLESDLDRIFWGVDACLPRRYYPRRAGEAWGDPGPARNGCFATRGNWTVDTRGEWPVIYNGPSWARIYNGKHYSHLLSRSATAAKRSNVLDVGTAFPPLTILYWRHYSTSNTSY